MNKRIDRIGVRPSLRDVALDPADYSVSSYVWLVAAVLSIALVCLNHDFDVVAGRIESTVESGGGLGEQAESEASLAGVGLQRKLGLAALVVAGALALVGPKTGVELRFNLMALLTATAICWAAASWLWSHERYETTRELVRLLLYAVTAALLVLRFHVRELIWMFLAVSLTSLAVDVAADIAAGTFRPWMAEFRLGGSLHPNHVGRLGAIVAMIAYAAACEPRYRRWTWPLFCAGVVAIVMSRSRSGLAAFAMGMVALHFIGLARRRFAFFAASAATVAAAALFCYGLTSHSLKRDVTRTLLFGRTEDAGSLTGRVPLWQEMLNDGSNHYWKGGGYGAYWTAERNYEVGDIIEWYPRHSHSIYMEVFIDLGLVGLALMVGIALLAVVQYSLLAAATGCFEYRLLGALIIAGLVNGVFEVGFVQPRFEGLFIGVAILLLFVRAPEQVLSSRSAREEEFVMRHGGAGARIAAERLGSAFPRRAWERG